jgi:vacuolar-type H+-ATPase subunit H
MVDDDLKRLLGAETRAQETIEKARSVSSSIIKKAEEEAISERGKRLNSFNEKRVKALEGVTSEGKIESERIRKEGIEIANGIRSKAKNRIPLAVDSVIKVVFQG